ncbi:MAG TPA: hypothetical protein VHL09_02995 [Dehalococcoidia bacterium]|nr:hypothetical protein [Dehalococcoidia bacterium]
MPPLLAICGAFLLGVFWAGVPVPWTFAGLVPVAILCLLTGRERLAPILALAFVAGLLRFLATPAPALEPASLLAPP